nr:delta-endotoxin [Beauveria bassiana]
MANQSSTKFDNFSKLPTWLLHTSSQVMAYAGDYLKLDLKDKWYDWKSFKQSLDQYKGEDLTFDKYKEVTIDRQDRTVQTMVDQIVNYLVDVLSITLGRHEIKALNATIQATFTTLKEKSSHGWLNFSSTTDHHNSSWEYRIQFAFPNPDIPDYFYALITTIKLEADITDESEWWGLGFFTKKSFSAEIHSIELVVKEGFKDPNRN